MAPRSTWSFQAANRLIYGSGAIAELGPSAQWLRINRALIVTDKALVNAGALDKARSSLEDSGIAVEAFTGGEPEPSLDAVNESLSLARDFKPNGIIGLGGGSNMDLAKTTATLLAHGKTARDYVGFGEIPGPTVPILCATTTAGTGSEVSGTAVLTDKENQVKVAILSPYLRPTLAIVDPELTLSCPKSATAASGIDALTHAIEAYLATDFSEIPAPPGGLMPYEGNHPLGDCLAEKAIRLIGEHLVTAVHQGDNLQAREGMSLAATIAGMAFSNCGVGLVHAMEYPLGGVLHCSHGEGNGLLLSHVMRFILPTRVSRMAKIAEMLGEDISGLSEEKAAEQSITAVERIRDAIGIRARVRDLGGTEDQLPAFAKSAFSIKRLMHLTPREPTEEAIFNIYQSAF